MKVSVGEGKYTVVMEENGNLHALRYGEWWRDITGDQLILALAQEIRSLRSLLEAQALVFGVHVEIMESK